MKKFEMAAFDLDGTLIDSKLDLSHAVNAMLAYMDRSPLDLETISSYVGNGAPVLMRRALGAAASDDDVTRALDYFIRYYHQHRTVHTRLYEGTEASLRELHAGGVKLAVLTNKPVRISQAILDDLGVHDLFFQVYGGNSFPEKKPHPMGLHQLLAESGTTNTKAVMVGDSAVDVRTAKNAEVFALGVTFGFQPDTFAAEPPDALIHHMAELPGVVLVG
jgi:phosphoglycolate phosphatase